MASIDLTLEEGLALVDGYSDEEITRAVNCLDDDPREWISQVNRAVVYAVNALRAEGIPDRTIYRVVTRMLVAIPADGIGGL
jgi:hypothetical protein